MVDKQREVARLIGQGVSVSEACRRLAIDRKTVSAYLAGDHVVGQRASTAADGFAPFVDYCRSRLGEDPHLWASTLFDELLTLGFTGSYPTLTRQLRDRGLRPVCQDCAHVKDRAAAIITHEPSEETQWDWLELPNPPAAWGWGGHAHLLVGSLAHSSRWRAVLAESEDQPHLIDALDRVTRALGGATRRWRFDRMATVCHPASGRVSASFAAVAKHYGVQVAICPPARGNRKGVVEKANHVAAQRWWRTLADDVTVEQAQASLDDWCRLRGDTRVQRTAGGDNVAVVAAREPLTDITSLEPFPAVLTVDRKVSGQATRFTMLIHLDGASRADRLRDQLNARVRRTARPTTALADAASRRDRLSASWRPWSPDRYGKAPTCASVEPRGEQPIGSWSP